MESLKFRLSELVIKEKSYWLAEYFYQDKWMYIDISGVHLDSISLGDVPKIYFLRQLVIDFGFDAIAKDTTYEIEERKLIAKISKQ